MKNVETEQVEEYHVDDLKLLLQHHGSAYYEDADALHALNHKETEKISQSILLKMGSFFKKSEPEKDKKDLKRHELIQSMD